MIDREKVIEDLNTAKYILISPQMSSREMSIKIGQAISAAIALLKEQEAIIEQYRRADGFLAAHGWKWEGR